MLRDRKLSTLNQTYPEFETCRVPGGRAGAKYEVFHKASGLRTVCILSTVDLCEAVIRNFERDRNNRGYWRQDSKV